MGTQETDRDLEDALMAFTRRLFRKDYQISAYSSDRDLRNKCIWLYTTADAVGTVYASGYFNDVKDELTEGDLIVVSFATNPGTPTETVTNTETIKVDTITVSGVTTATLGDALAETNAKVRNVLDFGAIADGVTDSLAAVNAATSGMSDEDVIYFPKGDYYFSNTLTIDHRINILCDPGVILRWDHNEVGDAPCLVWDGSAADNANYEPTFTGYPLINFSNQNTGSTNNFALQLRGVRHARVELGAVYGAYGGIRLEAKDGAYCAFNHISCGRINNAVVGIDLYADGTGSVDAWINSNWIEVGEYNYPNVASTAFRARRVNSPTDDNIAANTISFRTVEGGGVGTNTVAQFNAGKRNLIEINHLEDVDTIIDLIADEGEVTDNEVRLHSFQLQASSTVTVVDPPATGSFDTTPLNKWYGNIVTTPSAKNNANQWHSGDLAKRLYETDGAGLVAIPGINFCVFNTFTISEATPASTLVDIVLPGGDTHMAAVKGNFRFNPLVAVDTTVHKTFTFQHWPTDPSTASGRVTVLAFQADGTRYNPNATSDDTNRVSFEGSVASGNWGGSYSLSADERDTARVISVDDTIDYVFVGIQNGVDLRSFSISVPENSVHQYPLRVFPPLSDNSSHIPSITAEPATIGYYRLGWLGVYQNGSSGFEICTTAGWRADAWAISTAYAVGDLVANDTTPVKIYVCVTAGTSAGSGGPTGTGDSITDNTVTWNYLSDQAAFTNYV